MSQFNGNIVSIGDVLTTSSEISANTTSPVGFSIIGWGKKENTINEWWYGARIPARKNALGKQPNKKTGDELTWDDIDSLDLFFGDDENMLFETAEPDYMYIYYTLEHKFIVLDENNEIIFDSTATGIDDFCISWDLIETPNFVVYDFEFTGSGDNMQLFQKDNVLMHGDKQYIDIINKTKWRKYMINPKSEKYRVYFKRIYGDVMFLKNLKALHLKSGNNHTVRYETLSEGWRYVYRPQDATFTIFNADFAIDSQIKTTELEDFGISWEIFTSHQFYLEYEYWIYNDFVLFEEGLMSDGNLDKTDDGELTVVRHVDSLRANNPARKITGKYKLPFFKFAHESNDVKKIYGDELDWETLKSIELTSGKDTEIIFPQLTHGWEYYYRPYEELFTVKDENGDVRYELSTTLLSKFGLPWRIFSSHQFYLLWDRWIENDLYMPAKRKQKRNGYISLDKYLTPLLALVMATISNRGSAVYEPWMLWKLWQWLGTPSDEVIYTFDIMPNWG